VNAAMVRAAIWVSLAVLAAEAGLTVARGVSASTFAVTGAALVSITLGAFTLRRMRRSR